MGSHQTFEDPKLKGRNISVSCGSSSQSPFDGTGKQTLDEDYDMDLAYLQMTFPGLSEESLFDVYVANKGDLESAVDMLNQLEHYSGDSLENLPDTLDIGDVSEAGSSSELSALKLKNVADEVGGSSSGPKSDPLPASH